MISHKLKFIFIHIPKTSGNSLSLFLKNVIDNDVVVKNSIMGKNQGINIICEKTKKDIKHKYIKYYKKMYGSKIDNYFKFTIVRNPYNRILSYYFFTKGVNVFNRNEFIKFVKHNNSFQHKYINNNFYIIRYENLMYGLKNIKPLKRVVNFNKYPMLNNSCNSKKKYKSIFKDKYLKDLVYNKFKKDFILFDYKY